jgi:serine/threonine-protein kinase
MRGSNLARFMAERREPLDPVDAARLMIQIGVAVHYLHTQQPPIVHRDLKPHNILLDEAGKLYVADFGLAILLDGHDVEGGACGTIPYIAPEQFDSRFGDVCPASDIYSLGVILYELITGQPPFPRTRESILDTLNREPQPPRRRRAGIPKDLERVCLKCLRKSTRDRYTSAEQLVDDLRHFERCEPLPTPPDGLQARVSHWARREPALAARVAVIVACSVIMWGYRLTMGRYAALPPGHWAKGIGTSGMLKAYVTIEAVLVWLNQLIFVAWGYASWAFQRRLNTKRDQGGLQLGWRIADVVALSLLIELDDALMSPLTVAFAVLIVASAFWARADQIRQTTLLSMGGYIILAVNYHYNHRAVDRPYRHFHYLVALVLLGGMLTYQANRTRALARICGDRT